MSAQQKNLKRRRPPKRPSSKAARSITIYLPKVSGLKLSFYKHKTRGGKIQFNFALEVEPYRKSRKVSKTKRRLNLGKDVYYPELVWNWLKSKTKPAYILIALGAVGIFYFSAHLQKPAHFDIVHANPKVLAAAPAPAVKSLQASVPLELKVPKIGLDTPLKQTGVDANGAVAMPWDIEEADWYKYSPTPGQVGPSIIVGHLDGANYANIAGVFYKLNQLAPGDQIMVTRTDGTIAVFKVLYLKQVPQNNFPAKEVYGNIDYAGLRLITCGGTFDSATGHYTDNTVVFATLE